MVGWIKTKCFRWGTSSNVACISLNGVHGSSLPGFKITALSLQLLVPMGIYCRCVTRQYRPNRVCCGEVANVNPINLYDMLIKNLCGKSSCQSFDNCGEVSYDVLYFLYVESAEAVG